MQAQANVPITGLTPRTAIELVGRIRGGTPSFVRRRASELLDALDLGQWADTPAQKVSGGVARLTAFCMTVVTPSALVILDEPTNDVDPARRRLLWDAIRATAASGSAVMLITHNVREAEHAVDDLIVLDSGKVLAAGTPAQLTSHLSGELFLEIDGEHIPELPTGLRATSARAAQATIAVPSERGAEVVSWAQIAVGRGEIERFSLTPASLEETPTSSLSMQGRRRRHERHHAARHDPNFAHTAHAPRPARNHAPDAMAGAQAGADAPADGGGADRARGLDRAGVRDPHRRCHHPKPHCFSRQVRRLSP